MPPPGTQPPTRSPTSGGRTTPRRMNPRRAAGVGVRPRRTTSGSPGGRTTSPSCPSRRPCRSRPANRSSRRWRCRTRPTTGCAARAPAGARAQRAKGGVAQFVGLFLAIVGLIGVMVVLAALFAVSLPAERPGDGFGVVLGPARRARPGRRPDVRRPVIPAAGGARATGGQAVPPRVAVRVGPGEARSVAARVPRPVRVGHDAGRLRAVSDVRRRSALHGQGEGVSGAFPPSGAGGETPRATGWGYPTRVLGRRGSVDVWHRRARVGDTQPVAPRNRR